MLDVIHGSAKRVIVVGASPDALNSNAVLRGYVGEGFRAILGDSCVRSVAMEGAFEEVSRFHPDMVLVFGSCMPDSAYYISLRDYCDKKNVPLCFWLHDDPYEFDFHRKIVPYADFVFSNDRFATLHYPRGTATHLPLAASREAHFLEIMDESKMEYDVFFCGVAFENRIQMITDLDPILRKQRTFIVGPGWEKVGLPYCHGGSLSNKEFARNVNRSKFVLNIGRHSNLANSLYQLPPSTPGPRTYEAALAGGLQLYFAESLEILDYFDKDEEIFVFDSMKNLAELLLHPTESVRRTVRSCGQGRALRDHTYSNRARVILEKVGVHCATSQCQ